MREFTYGSSNAAKVLDILVSEDRRSSKSVSGYYHSFTKGLKEIDVIKNKRVKETVERLWIEKFKASIRISKLSEKVKNYLTNVIVGHYRDIVRERVLIIEKEREERKDEKRKARQEKKATATATILDVRIT